MKISSSFFVWLLHCTLIWASNNLRSQGSQTLNSDHGSEFSGKIVHVCRENFVCGWLSNSGTLRHIPEYFGKGYLCKRGCIVHFLPVRHPKRTDRRVFIEILQKSNDVQGKINNLKTKRRISHMNTII